MTNSFQILTININDISSEHYSLQELIYREDCDVVLVQETKIPRCSVGAFQATGSILTPVL